MEHTSHMTTDPVECIDNKLLRSIKKFLKTKYHRINTMNNHRIVHAERIAGHLRNYTLSNYRIDDENAPFFIDQIKKLRPDGNYHITHFPAINTYFEKKYEEELQGLNNITGQNQYYTRTGLFVDFCQDPDTTTYNILTNISDFFYQQYTLSFGIGEHGLLINESNKLIQAFSSCLKLLKMQNSDSLHPMLDITKKPSELIRTNSYRSPRSDKQ